MLRFTHFNPTGFYSFGICDTVNLDNNGLVFLNGRNEDQGNNPNGAGKSNFLRALARILIGEDGTKVKVADAINNVWKKGAWGFIQFDIDGENFRIIETRKWSKSAKYPVNESILGKSHLETLGETYTGTGLYFEKWDGQMWRDMRAGKRMEHTRALILDTIGMDYDGFCSTSYLAQRRGIKIIEAKPKERFELISPLADLEFWDKVGKLVHKELNEIILDITKTVAVAKEIEQQITTIDQISDEVFKQHQDAVDNADISIKKNKSELEECRNKLSKIASSSSNEEIVLREKLVKLSTELNSIVYIEPEEITNLKDTISSHNKSILNIKNHEIEQISRVEQNVPDADVTAASMDVEEIQADINHKKGLLENSNTEEGLCWYCGSEITKDHIAQHNQNLINDINQRFKDLKKAQDKFDNLLQIRYTRIQEIKDKIRSENKKKIDEFNRLIEVAENKIKKIKFNATQESSAAKETKIVEIEKVKQELNKFPSIESRNIAIEEIKKSIVNLETEISNIERLRATSLAQIQMGRKHNEDQAKKLGSLISRVGELQNEITAKEYKKEIYNSLNKEFGRAGIQAFEIGTLLDEFNHYLSNFIWVLTDGMLRVELSPYKEKKTAKHAFDHIAEITARVSDSYKQDTPLELYCGCETQQIVVAMLLAFRSLAMTRGAGTNIIALDEIDRSMSPYNTDRLVTLLDTIRKSIPTMFVISHNERTKNTMPADTIWTAVRRNGISHLEM